MSRKRDFHISGGTREDLDRIVRQQIFYQMQHPFLLDLFVEPTAKLRAVVHKDSAVLIVDVDEKSLRLQRPLGPGGGRLLETELRKEYGRRGILAAGLEAALAAKIPELCPKACKAIEQQVEFSDLAAFDLELKGSLYKSLRSSVHHAEREGIAVETYQPQAHAVSALKVFEEWNSLKPRVATYWIPELLKDPAQVPGLIAVVAMRRRKVLGISMALTTGDYAYMLLALALQEHGRAQEIMDYDLMCKLKSAGARRLDWGISDSGPISAYKKKYGHITRHPITTFWIPPPA